jgi:FAD/FMN-containing dehydrogenase
VTTSWGNYPKVQSSHELKPEWIDSKGMFIHSPCLPYGQGRSYGDVCLNENGSLIKTSLLNRFMEFDPDSGKLRCEAGMTLAEILQLITPYGYTLPVVPGTQFVSIGGAIANDVHGKNHHQAGTFGCHVISFELLRSNGERLICSKSQNTEWFQATIGGLGLTGLITWAEIQLKKIPSPFLKVETMVFENLESFFKINQASENHYEYTVAWLDCQSQRTSFGRGIYMRANYATADEAIGLSIPNKRAKTVPFNFPNFALNSFSMRLFNTLYFNKAKWFNQNKTMHYQPFFFPLDSLKAWNRIYGKRGFFQYQNVIEPELGLQGLTELLNTIVASKQGSFLSVLKTFGNIASPGMLSFPKPGVTLALDFPNLGSKTLALMEKLDQITLEHQGKVYPAKDARMSEQAFKQYYPNWQTFSQYIDPHFSSSFWRRVTGVSYDK